MKISSKLNELKPTDLNCNVFDVYSYDGLSMQELLCQFFTKINECVKVSNDTIDLASWLVNEGLKIEVVKKLMLWLEDGTLENLINVNLFNTLHTKIENINSQLAHIENERTKKVDYLTPKMFGAECDGVTDDTEALRKAIYESHTTGKMLFFPNGCHCLVSAPLNYYNDSYYDVKLNMRGVMPTAQWDSVLSKFGGIRVKNETNLFYNATISGEISNMNIVGIRNENIHFFDSCRLLRMYIHGCNITNWGAFLYDTSMVGVSRIDSNTFLTVFYFHRHNSIDTEITDSFITNNYINGGQEPVDNACFEFKSGNGSVVQGNFIDYYKVIYRPKPNAVVQFPTSVGNQYQVFLYLYEITHGGTFNFTSIGDTFNWTDEDKLEKLKTYKKSTYTGKDGETYEIPTYIAMSRHSSSVNITNAYIQRNVGNVVFIYDHIGEYEIGEFNVSFSGVSKYRSNSVKLREGSTLPYFINGNYDYNTIDTWFIEKVDSIPTINTPWASHPIGYKIRCNGQNYRFVKRLDKESGVRKPQWVEFDDI